jgi:hypothetical protein
MKKAIYPILVLIGMFVGCTNDPEDPSASRTVTHHRPKTGSEYHMSWSRYDRFGVRENTSRTDTIITVISHDTSMNGVSHVTVFGSIDPEYPGSVARAWLTRVDNNNDLQLSDSRDDITFGKWVTYPVETDDTIIAPFDSVFFGANITGTITTIKVGNDTVHMDGRSLQVTHLRQLTSLVARENGVQVAMVNATRDYLYAPSIGFFTAMNDIQQGSDVDQEAHFRDVRQRLQRYLLK